MERSRVSELHFIAPIANLESIMRLGILSHNRAEVVDHVSVAKESVQDLRRGVLLPNGVPLHDYANLYFDARNPMMYLRQRLRDDLAVVRIRPSVLDTPGAVLADGNAASDVTRFYPSPQGLAMLDEQRVYARWWNDSDPWVKIEKKRQRCAEVLIPDGVPREDLMGCYVCSPGVEQVCESLVPGVGTEVNARVFFG